MQAYVEHEREQAWEVPCKQDLFEEQSHQRRELRLPWIGQHQ